MNESLSMIQPTPFVVRVLDRNVTLVPELKAFSETERFEYACVMLAWSDVKAANEILDALRAGSIDLSPQSISSIRLAANSP